MELTNTPCAMCGITGYKRTRQHVLKKEWRKLYPTINAEMSSFKRLNTLGSYDSSLRDIDYFNQQVGPFCAPCNNEFMSAIEDDVAAVIDRLFTTDTLTVEPAEIEPLRRWAYMTMLVRSLLDRSLGHSAPEIWFRKFHSSGGVVPPNASFLFARVNTDVIRHASAFMVHKYDREVVTIIDSALLVGGFFLIAGMHSATSPFTSAQLRSAWHVLPFEYPGRIADLTGAHSIQLTGPLLLEETADVRSPTSRQLMREM